MSALMAAHQKQRISIGVWEVANPGHCPFPAKPWMISGSTYQLSLQSSINIISSGFTWIRLLCSEFGIWKRQLVVRYQNYLALAFRNQKDSWSICLRNPHLKARFAALGITNARLSGPRIINACYFQINIFLAPMKLAKVILWISKNAICLIKYSGTGLLVLKSD